MIARVIALLIPLGLFATTSAAGEARRIKIRALLHDPLKPTAELYVQGATARERLNLSLEGIAESQEATLTNGSLQIFSSLTADSAKPLANLAASAPAAANLKQAIVLIVPAGGQSATPYRMMLIDDSTAAFPMGESRMVNLTTLEIACQAGEHRKLVKPASVEAIPKVTKVNDMNQAATQFYQKSGNNWVLLSERPTQYTDQLRNLFLLYTMPNVPEAQVRTLIDTPQVQP